MVVASHPLAAEAGRAVLARGGSAIDAAIAAELVLGLVEPQSSGVGGGGLLLHYDAESGALDSYDGRETAPAGASPDMFLEPSGRPKDFDAAAVGGLAVGVPGLVAMLETAHREHGRLRWADLFEPAIALAEQGFPVSHRLAEQIARDPHLARFPETAAYFLRPDGSPREAREILVNRPLAETYRALAARGAAALYECEIARDIVAAVRHAPGNPGRLTEADLSAYHARARPPLCGPYRVWRVCGMGLPSSGAVAVLQTLGLLERFDLAALEPASLAAVHLVAEASRLAFADRDAYLGDADFVPVPAADLLRPAYLDARAKLISTARSMGRAAPGLDSGAPAAAPVSPPSTTHVSVVDAAGNAVALTSSIESEFGSHLMVRGFLLNNQLTDFSFLPERDGRAAPNRAEPGKRPLNSMAPTFVFDADGKLVFVVGSPGGTRIIGYVVKTLIATLDWKLDPQRAVELPNFVNRNDATELEAGTWIVELAPALEALGHEVAIGPLASGLNAIRIGPRGLMGGADPRRGGAARGE